MIHQEELITIKGKRSKRPRLASPSPPLAATTTGDVSPSNSSGADDEDADMANCLILLAKGQTQRPSPQYQCKTCSKSFPSFQALGGHRTSHKKPTKPTNLEREEKQLMREKQDSFMSEEEGDGFLSLQISNNSRSAGRVHECSICGAEFGSGQALGGHMRRHRPTPAAAAGEAKRERNMLCLDLNLPAPEDDHPESKFPFAAKQQVIVFSASPLIDCHY